MDMWLLTVHSEKCGTVSFPTYSVTEITGEIVYEGNQTFAEKHPEINFLIGLLLLIGMVIAAVLLVKWILEEAFATCIIVWISFL